MSVLKLFVALRTADIAQIACAGFCMPKVGFTRWPAKSLMVMALVLGVQIAPAPSVAQSAPKRVVPSSEKLPQVLTVIERTRGNDASPLSELVRNMFKTSSKDPWQGPDKGTFYDRKGRLRSWVQDPAVPGGFRALESPPMELRRKATGGLIDWGFESDYVGTDLGDLPLISSKPVKDQSYQERTNAKMRFTTKMGLSLSMPNPLEIDKEYILRGKITGGTSTGVTVRWWIDGEEKTGKETNYFGRDFALPLKFSTSGIHSLKVETLDADGVKRTRFIRFPVGFKLTTETLTATDRTMIRVISKGSRGPFNASFTASDGQKFVQKGYNALSQTFSNPGLTTIKWIDVVVEDTKVGYVVSKRIKLDDVPVVASLTADETELAPDENAVLRVDIKGGEPPFKMILFVDGQSRQARIAKNRKGKFFIPFDEPGIYSVYAEVGSKNIAGKKILNPTQTITLTVVDPESEPPVEERKVSVLTGVVEPFQVSKSGFKWLGLPGWMKGSVTITISGTDVSANITYEANDLIYTDYTGVASGVISGYLTREGKIVLAGRIPYQANDLSGCEKTNNSGDQRTCKGSIVVWIKGRRIGNRLEGNWQFDRKHDGTWKSAALKEVFLTPDEAESFDKNAAEAVAKFDVGVTNSNEYDLFKDALRDYFE
jgi:hypothetical protein